MGFILVLDLTALWTFYAWDEVWDGMTTFTWTELVNGFTPWIWFTAFPIDSALVLEKWNWIAFNVKWAAEVIVWVRFFYMDKETATV